VSSPLGTAPPLIRHLIDEATVQEIADETWCALLGVEEVLVPMPGSPSGDALSAWVEVSGPWTGAVVLTCGHSTAEQLCRTLLRASCPEPLDTDDVADAMGELANVVGGNVKALLPAPSVLGLPGVGSLPPAGSPADTCRVEVRWRGQPITVSVQGAPRRTPDAREGDGGL
jgi:chemotaxis protein CheX